MPAYTHQRRTYLHFDPPPSAKTAADIATSPTEVARHSFYPFLGFTISTPKVQKGANGMFVRKEKARPIKLAAHIDAAIYAHYGRILGEQYEAQVAARGIGGCVIAFRRSGASGRNNITFANETFEFIRTHRPCVAIGLDVEKFFDRIDHALLKTRWADTLATGRLPADHFRVFENLTEFRWVDRDAAFRAVGISPHNPRPRGSRRNRICDPLTFRTKIRGSGLVWVNPERSSCRGIPQGAPISALLSNLYMVDFDTAMNNATTACGGFYRRYCDDIMVVVPPDAAASVEALAMSEIGKLKLTINPDKTTHAVFPEDAGLPAQGGSRIQYLGFDYDGLRKLIRASSLGRYYGKMRSGVRLAGQTRKKHNMIAAGQGCPVTGLRTRQLYIRYSYLICRRFRRKAQKRDRQNENFITYAYRAAKIMAAPEIKHQVRNHLVKLKAEIHKVLK